MCAAGFALVALLVWQRGALPGDWALVMAAYDSRSDALTAPIQLVTFITSAAPALVLCMAWTAIELRRGGLQFAAAWPLVAYFGHLACNIALRVAIGRLPPDVEHIPNLLPEFRASFQQYAFPSGHAGAAVIAYGALIMLAWRTRWRMLALIVALVIILGTGIGRVYLGVHWPSDVLGGWLLSSAWLAIAHITPGAASRGREAVPAAR
jgi:undecaprenyl-diphosphatase